MVTLSPINFVKCEKNVVQLNSGLDELMFAKTKFSLLLDEKGIIAKKSQNGAWNNFSEWKFNESKTLENNVYFCGNFAGLSLNKMIETANPYTEKALYSVCEIYSEAILQNKTIPCNGPAGIIIKTENNEINEILFLPEKTLDRSAANFGKTFFNFIQNSWRDGIATGKAALCFSLGTFAYYSVTKMLPYNEEKDQKISDRNFLPVEYVVNGINKNLSYSINSLLLGKLLKSPFPLEKLKEEIFEKESENHKISEEKFNKKVKKFKNQRKSNLKRNRFIHKNIAIAATIFLATVFVLIFIFTIISENGKKPSVIGLDSTQVTEVFYKGLHTMDTDFMLCAAKNCKEAQSYISKVPQLYVAGQMRSAYNFDSGISTPENWFFFEPDSTKSYSHYIYGITNFFIDEKPYALDIKVPTKKNHPTRKIYAEDGSKNKIENSEDAVHKVHYFLVHNQDNFIQIEEFTTVVTLLYEKNAWTITKLDETSSSEIISPLEISLDYKKALEENGKNEILAINSLRKKYIWLPTEKSMQIEKERLDKIGY